jgi:hypothetical protein
MSERAASYLLVLLIELLLLLFLFVVCCCSPASGHCIALLRQCGGSGRRYLLVFVVPIGIC